MFLASLDDPEPKRLTGEEEDDADEDEKPRYSVSSVGPGGEWVVATSKQGFWLLDADGEEPYLFLERDEDDELTPQYRVVEWSADGESFYLSYASRREWERGLFRYDIAGREMTELVKDGRLYSGWSLSEDGSTLVFSAAPGNRPYDLYAADPEFSQVRRLTTLNPDLEAKRLGRTELIFYLDVGGHTLHGVVYYPADY